ncbi:nucleolar complex-associated protein 2 isoform X1 [Cryptomeria japonica]|uniref:nucleolar complex-associated protein 2 isoform X1 n=2 Tax=Cryptomeria japonica TaxID=3369 RepID=UPI0027DA45F7|nr:nucleolar complex-associated protein 2 isoform X1 [Cryptomeria japonica]XP_057830088.2 nucleolar complex-associated protein 2 isoform X1 [Cryptomeria japonica]XP_057830089.2 nucleolar complex-associated protein 2 isoform X1 [Cryptomeria japonica]
MSKLRNIEKNHSKTIMESKHKLKPKKTAFKRKQSDTRASIVGGNEGTARIKSKTARRKSLKKNLGDMNVDELMEGNFMDSTSTEDKELVSINDDMHSKDGKDYIDITPDGVEDDSEDKEEDDNTLPGENKKLLSESKKHKRQLERLKEKDPEFFEFLKDHDKELLQFSDEDNDEFEEDDKSEDEELAMPGEEQMNDMKDFKQLSRKIITTTIVDGWCKSIVEDQSLGALRSLMQAFRTACHYGDSDTDDSGPNLGVMTSNVFNKIMVFVLTEVDGIFRKLLGISSSGGKKDTILELKQTRRWAKIGSLVKSYLSNSLHVLNQMTDNRMISFTIRRLRSSIIFLAVFPTLLRKYVKAALHFWGSGEGALSVVSFLFIRDMAVRMGSDCLEACLKGIYKAYVANCKFVNSARLQQIQFLGNCVVELYGVDLASAYQHAFVFIRQLAMILRNAITMKTKEAFKQVYCWKFICCLELWVKVLCRYTGKDDLQPLAYPVAQIISGVARLVPTARYFPLRVQCTKMLNRLGFATETYIHVASLVLDMLEFKELNRPPTGGVGKAVDFSTILKVPKPTLKTRAFQEECVFSVLEHLAEHLTQWSYSVSFPELAFIPLVRLRQFNKYTKVDRFRRQVKQLIEQVEKNIEYIARKRGDISFAPKDQNSVATFLQTDKEAGASPLSQYLVILQRRSEQRKANLRESSVNVVDDKSTHLTKDISKTTDESDHDDVEDGSRVFSKNWLPEKKSNKDIASDSKMPRKSHMYDAIAIGEDDIVETLEFSSDEDDSALEEFEDDSEKDLEDDHHPAKNQTGKNGKANDNFSKAAKRHKKYKKLGKRKNSQKKQQFSRVKT